MQLHRNAKLTLCLLLTYLMLVHPLVPRVKAAPQERGGNPGVSHADDPCDQLPDPPGKAKGIDRQCPAGGSSSGIAKGDFNGDGFADLAIGEPGATIGGKSSAGDVIVVYGSGNGLTATGRQLWYEGRIDVTGSPASGDRFGSAMASGDFNHDGYSDLAIGIPYKATSRGAHSGAVVVLYGSPSGLTVDDPLRPFPRLFDLGAIGLPTTCNLTGCRSPNASEAHLGSSLAWGDFNGDGIGDLAIGAPNMQWNFDFIVGGLQAGLVWELFGDAPFGANRGGLSLNRNTILDEASLPSNSGFGIGGEFGAVLAGGDFNGDGYSDLAVGVPHKDFPNSSGSDVADAGEVGVLYGSSSGLSASKSQRWTQASSNISGTPEAGDLFGAALAAGDFNHDGKTDLAIGVPGEDVSGFVDAGAVSVLYGSDTGITDTGQQFWQQSKLGPFDQNGAQFGSSLAAGDFNGDGSDDLAIGVPLEDIGNVADAGQVAVIYGSSTGLSATTFAPKILQNLISLHSGDRFGAALTAWNFGRNEVTFSNGLALLLKTADLAVGVPYQDVNGVSNAGAADIFYGSVFTHGLSTGNSAVLTADNLNIGGLAGAHFGAAMY
jgi:hypothetical protein